MIIVIPEERKKKEMAVCMCVYGKREGLTNINIDRAI